MNVYKYAWQHCGLQVQYVKIGVTSYGELAVMWRCPKCQKDIMARVPLENIIADVPASEPAEFNEQDNEWLKKCHILLPSSDSAT